MSIKIVGLKGTVGHTRLRLAIIGYWDKDKSLFLETIRTPNHNQSNISIVNILTILTSPDICYNSAHFDFLLLKLNKI